jgi:hypothetical protein
LGSSPKSHGSRLRGEKSKKNGRGLPVSYAVCPMENGSGNVLEWHKCAEFGE